ncbi:MAG: YicC family protein [Treponema sp.]|jgi:uncharacterized protein (TIGR00255 family)|nr:YicC family protein [Treponema sp.]
MTSYAYREVQSGDISLSVELKGYNNRFLEISVYLPPWLSGLEARCRELMAEQFKRGKIEVGIKVKENNALLTVGVNRTAAGQYIEAFSSLAESLHIDEKPSLALILNMEGVLDIEKNRDDSRIWRFLEPVLKEAAAQFDAEREREGRHTEEDILSHIAVIETQLQAVARQAPLLESSIKENLRTRFRELLEDQIDENRILAETAVLLMKYTISEEISRLSSHLAEFRRETGRNPSPGKKLDFLAQEINREINTIGSKTPVLEVSRAVVEMKNALENIREQLRNVE